MVSKLDKVLLEIGTIVAIHTSTLPLPKLHSNTLVLVEEIK